MNINRPKAGTHIGTDNKWLQRKDDFNIGNFSETGLKQHKKARGAK